MPALVLMFALTYDLIHVSSCCFNDIHFTFKIIASMHSVKYRAHYLKILKGNLNSLAKFLM